MKILQSIIFVFILLNSTTTLADSFIPAKVTLTDGEILKGFVKPPNPSDDEIEFRLNENAKKQKIESDLIKILTIYFESDTVEYERLKTYGLSKKKKIYQPSWLIVLERGYATLYFAFVDGGAGQGNIMPSDKYWLCYRPNEEAASIISWVIGRINANFNFKIRGPEYFKDYPELAEKIKNKTYKYDKINEVVREYNKWKEDRL